MDNDENTKIFTTVFPLNNWSMSMLGMVLKVPCGRETKARSFSFAPKLQQPNASASSRFPKLPERSPCLPSNTMRLMFVTIDNYVSRSTWRVGGRHKLLRFSMFFFSFAMFFQTITLNPANQNGERKVKRQAARHCTVKTVDQSLWQGGSANSTSSVRSRGITYC